MPHGPLFMTLGIAAFALGVAVLGLVRLRPGAIPTRFSPVTVSLAGVALLAMGYHVFVYAANLPQFRLPLLAVLVGAPAVVALSAAIDLLENRRAGSPPRNGA
ncbi:MAG: hypothetical protein IBJ11_10285 [Phycisphaerales bacterium]|nr:hypothetical protein [Phycisphaerales bacterium]